MAKPVTFPIHSDKAIYNYQVFSLIEPLEPPVSIQGDMGNITIGGGIIWVKYPGCWRKSIVDQ